MRSRLTGLCVHWQRLYEAVNGERNGDEAIGAQLPPGIMHELKVCDLQLSRLYRRLLKEHRR